MARTRCATAARLRERESKRAWRPGHTCLRPDFQLLLLVSAFGQERSLMTGSFNLSSIPALIASLGRCQHQKQFRLAA